MRVLIASLLLAGCVAPNGDESFIIRNNLAPAGDGTCVFTADVTAPILSRGLIDANSPLPYILHPLFESRIVAAEGRESLRTIQLTGAEVQVEIGPIELIADDGSVTVDDFFDNSIGFTSLFASSLGPNQSTSTASVDIVPLSALALIRARAGAVAFNAQVVAIVTPFGDYYGEEIEGTEFRYPVTVCSNCIRQFVKVCDAMMPEATALAATNGCNAFQDGIIECCAIAGSNPPAGFCAR